MRTETDHEKFKIIKKELKLTNKSIAEVIGQSEQNIKNQCNSRKPLGKVPLLMVWFYENYLVDKKKRIRDEDFFIVGFLNWFSNNATFDEYGFWKYKGREKTFRQMLFEYRKRLNEIKPL